MTKYPRLSRPRAPLALDVPLQLEAHLQLQGKTHRVGPDFGSTLTVSSRDYQSKCWVNPVNFRFSENMSSRGQLPSVLLSYSVSLLYGGLYSGIRERIL